MRKMKWRSMTENKKGTASIEAVEHLTQVVGVKKSTSIMRFLN